MRHVPDNLAIRGFMRNMFPDYRDVSINRETGVVQLSTIEGRTRTYSLEGTIKAMHATRVRKNGY